MINKVFAYLEKHLGTEVLRSTAKSNDTGQVLDVSLSLFNHQPATDAFTLASTGMSNKIFKQPDGISIRHELLFCAYNQFRSDKIYENLFDVIAYQLEQDESVCAGELFDCEAPIMPNSPLEAFLFYSPIYFKEALYLFEAIKPPVAFVWAIPIHRKELTFIANEGADAFDDLLEKYDPDLLDLNRAAIVA
jgi:hypothetical protein